MKRILICLFAIVCFVMSLPLSAGVQAAPIITNDFQTVSTYTEYYQDGYAEITVTKKVSKNGILAAGNEYYIIGSKTYTWYDVNGKPLWDFVVIGDFRVIHNEYVVCIAASGAPHSFDKAWSCSSSTAFPEFNIAVGKATFKRKILFVTVDTRKIEVRLYCSKTGQLS